MISDIAESVGLTARAIRHYEARGLISPSRDFRNQRRFNRETRARLALIAALRAAGLSLPDIGRVLDAATLGSEGRGDLLRSLLEAQRVQIEAQGAQIAHLLAGLDAGVDPEAAALRCRN